MTKKALDYTWHQLAVRTGIPKNGSQCPRFERLGVSIHYGHLHELKPDQSSIIIVPCSSSAWYSIVKQSAHRLSWLPAHKVVPPGVQVLCTDEIPVLFWGEGYEDGSKPFAEQRSDGTIVFYADIIAATFFMLSRWEEIVVAQRDAHSRFPATASVAYRQGFLDRPIIDEYALILRAWLTLLRPNWQPKPQQFSIKLTHDVDSVRRLRNAYSAALVFGADLLVRRSLTRARQTLVDLFRQKTMPPEQLAYFKAIFTLARLSNESGHKSTFYFMTAQPSSSDNDYEISSAFIQHCIETLRHQGHEIGLHPSYYTLNNPKLLAEEKARLDWMLGETHYGGRQHYLRFRVPDTWRDWEQVGLTYDSTMGYADYEGFRCGTCHPFQPFDIVQDRQLNLWEWPLITMDQTLKNYRKLSPEQGKERILTLVQRCRRVGGTFTLLWHNSSMIGEWQPWAEVYKNLLANRFAELTDDNLSEAKL